MNKGLACMCRLPLFARLTLLCVFRACAMFSESFSFQELDSRYDIFKNVKKLNFCYCLIWSVLCHMCGYFCDVYTRFSMCVCVKSLICCLWQSGIPAPGNLLLLTFLTWGLWASQFSLFFSSYLELWPPLLSIAKRHILMSLQQRVSPKTSQLLKAGLNIAQK